MDTRNRSSDLRLLLILFVTSRLMLMAALTPEAITAYGDYAYLFDIAQLSRDGHLPFLDFWQEYPPVFPFLSLVIYQLTAATGAFHSYAYALAIVMLLFDAGNLALLFKMAHRALGQRRAERLAWVYVALPVSMVYTWRTFDSLTTFWILLALCWLLPRNHSRTSTRQLVFSALALGLGIMTKYVPVILIPVVWALMPIRKALTYSLIVLVVCLLILGPFLIASPELTWASIQAQFTKSSWETVWALIDGNLGTGSFGPILDHFDPDLSTRPLGNPSRIPVWITLCLFGGLGLTVLIRVRSSHRRFLDHGHMLLRFSAFTLAMFLLWSRGWSPQWQTMLFPLVLLAIPDRNGILFCALFGVINFLEWPVILSRGLNEWLWLTVAARTALLVGLAVALASQLLARPPEQEALTSV